MKHGHAMPFGAEWRTDASVRFRLWAPAAKKVEVVIESEQGASSLGTSAGATPASKASGAASTASNAKTLDVRAMQPQADGWFELTATDTPPGTRYRYRIDGDLAVPDPASRFNPNDVHGPSVVINPNAFEWPDDDWRGRPWNEAVIYELHVGTFSPEGTFDGVIKRLDHLVSLGVTVIELMPLADFPGRHGWGYDGVLPFAPDAAYGTPDDLKRLVAAAHARGLMVMIDVVYNHFGPDGNYLGAYAPQFFTERHHTPWGAAIDYSRRAVRDFAIHNALYWIEEYHVDGLRLDAVHAIKDDGALHVLDELAQRVNDGPGRERQVHLVLENDDNGARYLERSYRAQWNDDIHHAFHTIATGEADGYYADYARAPAKTLGRCLAEGFAFQGDASAYRDGEPRGEPSKHLPPTAFVSFAQNHDQVGNRAFGERIDAIAPPEAVEAITAIHLLSPQIPLLFMGEEFAAETPFLYFCDHSGDLAKAVTEGRGKEFGRFAKFGQGGEQAIPDPNAPATLEASRLDWTSLPESRHAQRLHNVRALLALRAQEIAPRLANIGDGHRYETFGERGLVVRWNLGDGKTLVLDANLGAEVQARAAVSGRVLHRTLTDTDDASRAAWAVRFVLLD